MVLCQFHEEMPAELIRNSWHCGEPWMPVQFGNIYDNDVRNRLCFFDDIMRRGVLENIVTTRKIIACRGRSSQIMLECLRWWHRGISTELILNTNRDWDLWRDKYLSHLARHIMMISIRPRVGNLQPSRSLCGPSGSLRTAFKVRTCSFVGPYVKYKF